MDTIRIVELVLAALIIGAAIPTLVQLRGAIVELRRLARQSAEHIAEISQAAEDLAERGRQVRETARLASAFGAAVVPAVSAAVRVLRRDDSSNGFHDQSHDRKGKERSP